MIPLVVLRPEPGLSASLERARAAGLEAIGCPMTRIEPVDWALPDLDGFTTLMFTSANAPALLADQREALAGLEVVAVGDKTGEAARRAGFEPSRVGDAGVEALVAALPADARILHPCAVNFRKPEGRADIAHLPVYRTVPTGEVPPDEGEYVFMAHSPWLASLLAMAIDEAARADKSVVAISQQAAIAAGPGWASVRVADAPRDEAMLSLALTLCQTGGR